MLKLSNVVQEIVISKLRYADYNSGLIINTVLDFMEWFEEEIDETEVKKLQEKFPNLTITQSGIEARLYGNFLFINRDGFFSCFSNVKDRKPQNMSESEWIFSTNHDTCWRDNAFSDFEDELYKIKSNICYLNDIKKLGDIYIPKHVIPNYSNIEISENFNFNVIDTIESYKHNTHKMLVSKKGTKIIIP